MSVQVRVSYETDDELLQITERLSDLEFVVSTSPQRGQYKRSLPQAQAGLQACCNAPE